jgi:hypothetical protein
MQAQTTDAKLYINQNKWVRLRKRKQLLLLLLLNKWGLNWITFNLRSFSWDNVPTNSACHGGSQSPLITRITICCILETFMFNFVSISRLKGTNILWYSNHSLSILLLFPEKYKKRVHKALLCGRPAEFEYVQATGTHSNHCKLRS